MIGLVVDADEGAVLELEVLDILAGIDGPDPALRTGRQQRDREEVLRAVPELELVFGEVETAIANPLPLKPALQSPRRNASAGVDASHHIGDVARAGRRFLAGIAGRDRDA